MMFALYLYNNIEIGHILQVNKLIMSYILYIKIIKYPMPGDEILLLTSDCEDVENETNYVVSKCLITNINRFFQIKKEDQNDILPISCPKFKST